MQFLASPAPSRVQVLFCQETKLLTKEALVRASVSCSHLGWTFYGSKCLHGDNGGLSSGVAILVRQSLGSQALCDSALSGVGCNSPLERPGYLPMVIVEGRISAIKIDAFGQAGVVCISLYLKDGIGLIGENWRALLTLAEFLSGVGVPFVIGGDWNSSPECVIESGFCGLIRGRVFAPDGPPYVNKRSESKILWFRIFCFKKHPLLRFLLAPCHRTRR